MSAYQEIYLSNIMNLMGEMMDYAINDAKLNVNVYYRLFTSSAACRSIEKGYYVMAYSYSGVELVKKIVREKLGKEITARQEESGNESPEYWAGKSIAYYQWYTGRKFSEIDDVIPFENIINMYYTFNGAETGKLMASIDRTLRSENMDTRLKKMRESAGMSQSRLSAASGVSLRSIQMYEQRHKNINKAGADVIYSLSHALGCLMEDLMEPAIFDD